MRISEFQHPALWKGKSIVAAIELDDGSDWVTVKIDESVYVPARDEDGNWWLVPPYTTHSRGPYVYDQLIALMRLLG